MCDSKFSVINKVQKTKKRLFRKEAYLCMVCKYDSLDD